jgi:hypothetical protein
MSGNEEANKYCSFCGAVNDEESVFCTSCGQVMDFGDHDPAAMDFGEHDPAAMDSALPRYDRTESIFAPIHPAAPEQISATYGQASGSPVQATVSPVPVHAFPADTEATDHRSLHPGLLVLIIVLAACVIGLGVYVTISKLTSPAPGEDTKTEESQSLASSETGGEKDATLPKNEANENGTTDSALTIPGGDTQGEAEPGENAVVYGAPVFTKVTSSSNRDPMTGYTYTAALAFDGDPVTAWCEGGNGEGLGEWIRFSADTDQQIRGFRILNGYFQSKELYAKNNSVKSLVVTLADGTSFTVNLDYDDTHWQDFDFEEPVVTKNVTFTINSVYIGSSDIDDTLISEVEFY